MKLVKFLFVAAISAISLSAAAANQVGQKCRPVGPLSPTDTVDKVARCFCESGAHVMGAAFNSASSEAYRPQDIREWSQPDKRKRLMAWADTDSNFVTLVESKDLGQESGRIKKMEKYYYYQAADRESGALQTVLNQIVFAVDTPADGRGFTNCNVISVTSGL